MQMVRGEEVHGVDARVRRRVLVAAVIARAAILIAVGLGLAAVAAGEVKVEQVGHVADFVKNFTGVIAATHYAK